MFSTNAVYVLRLLRIPVLYFFCSAACGYSIGTEMLPDVFDWLLCHQLDFRDEELLLYIFCWWLAEERFVSGSSRVSLVPWGFMFVVMEDLTWFNEANSYAPASRSGYTSEDSCQIFVFLIF